MIKNVRIGTRDSELAVWQARFIGNLLADTGISYELVHIKSEGDLDLSTPLAEMGGKGVFTKALDEALLNGDIDLAVHSFKDLPTDNPLPIRVVAVPKRHDPRDTLVAPLGTDFLNAPDTEAIIATGSNRRKAQWLHRYPNHKITDIRGNVNTRLKKVSDNRWHGAIFAASGLQRIGLEKHISVYLDWMVPAPAQGALAVVARDDAPELAEICRPLNHKETAICTEIERDLLHELEAGCSAPVGAFAEFYKKNVYLYAVVLSIDGSLQYDIELESDVENLDGLGKRAGRELLGKGAGDLI